MKIKNNSNLPPASNNEKTDITTPLHPPSPEDASSINRIHNPKNPALDPDIFDETLPDPIDLAHYAATGSLHALQDKLLAAAEKILLTMPDNPKIEARHQVIDLVLQQNFRSVITGNEKHEIANTLKRALTNDPVFCAEVDNMLDIAAQKLKLNDPS